jgi:hypothetical protein
MHFLKVRDKDLLQQMRGSKKVLKRGGKVALALSYQRRRSDKRRSCSLNFDIAFSARPDFLMMNAERHKIAICMSYKSVFLMD